MVRLEAGGPCWFIKPKKQEDKMGMYTEFFFRARVDAEAVRMVREFNEQGVVHNDTFFHAQRASSLFWNAEFPVSHTFKIDSDLGGWAILTIHSCFKNYGSEIEKFLAWIAPHIITYDDKKFLGFSLYEENEEPTFYYVDYETKKIVTN
jgi:hypothetical protein